MNSKRVSHRIDDCRRWTVHRKFADALRSIGSVNISQLFEEDANVRQVVRGWHNVIGHLAVLHASVLPNDFFIKTESDRLGDTTYDLSSCQKRVQNFAN